MRYLVLFLTVVMVLSIVMNPGMDDFREWFISQYGDGFFDRLLGSAAWELARVNRKNYLFFSIFDFSISNKSYTALGFMGFIAVLK